MTRRWMIAVLLGLSLLGSLWIALTPTDAATLHPWQILRSARVEFVAPPLVSPYILAKASNVATCEEGGWNNVDGPLYFGALGWLEATWAQFRAPSFPGSMYDATPAQQAWAMAHFVGADMGGWWPDQTGCTGGY